MPTSAQTEFAENDCESIAFYRWVDVGIDPYVCDDPTKKIVVTEEGLALQKK